MTFNSIISGDPADPSKVMENFRHVNYGANYLPVNSSGVAVHETLDLGSASNAWKDLYVKNLNISGVFSVANQPILLLNGGSVSYNNSGATLSGYTTSENIGGFTVSSGKLYVPSAGVYAVQASVNIANFDSRNCNLYIRAFDSTDTATHDYRFARMDVDVASTVNVGFGQRNMYVRAGGYITLFVQSETSGGTSTADNATLSILKLF
jgi:hypothetical protein